MTKTTRTGKSAYEGTHAGIRFVVRGSHVGAAGRTKTISHWRWVVYLPGRERPSSDGGCGSKRQAVACAVALIERVAGDTEGANR